MDESQRRINGQRYSSEKDTRNMILRGSILNKLALGNKSSRPKSLLDLLDTDPKRYFDLNVVREEQESLLDKVNKVFAETRKSTY